jgi:hypothetical protein
VCKKCGLIGVGVFFLLTMGPERSITFVGAAMGTPGPLAEQLYPGEARRKFICTVVFCQKHLEELEACQRPFKNYLKESESPQSIQDFVNNAQSEEAQHMVRVMICVFSLFPIKRNGWCIFESVVRVLKLDFAEFIKKLKAFARNYLKKKANTAFL